MQLFAILVKQGGSVSKKELDYVKNFLSTIVSEEDTQNFYSYFLEKLDRFPEKNKVIQETSPLDSVDVIRLCFKINHTLNQEQKIISILRSLELIKNNSPLKNKDEILETCANVFKIRKQEYDDLKTFVLGDENSGYNESSLRMIAIRDSTPVIVQYYDESDLLILRLESTGQIFIKLSGDHRIELNKIVLRKDQIVTFPYGSVLNFPGGIKWYFATINNIFQKAKVGPGIAFEVIDLKHTFEDGTVGLHEISFNSSQGNLIALMGGSGSGKTTLLKLLAGMESPDMGQVLLNKINIHENDASGLIGYVSQDDLLIEELSVFDNLYYSAKLSFNNLNNKDLSEKVLKILRELNLYDQRYLKVGSIHNKVISGGQRKRLNIGLELIRNPHVLFLDEPLSGLSSGDSDNVMQLLSELRENGALIFLVVHQPSSEIYKQFDEIIILDKGGFCVYIGNPIESLTYFKNVSNKINKEVTHCMHCSTVRPQEIFEIIDERIFDEYGNPTTERKLKPGDWYANFRSEYYNTRSGDNGENKNNLKSNSNIRNDKPGLWMQWIAFIQRDIKSKLANPVYIFLLLAQPVVLSLILSFLIRDSQNEDESYVFFYNTNVPAYFFMSIIVLIFIGLTMSAQELFRDRRIRIREDFLDLSRLAYLLAKISQLTFISAIQVVLFVIPGNTILEYSGQFPDFAFLLFAVIINANILGLLISNSFSSATSIYIVIPLLIIPQMILGGAMFSYDELNFNQKSGGRAPLISSIIPARWAYEAIMVKNFIGNSYEKEFYEIDKKLSNCRYLLGPFISELYELIDQNHGNNEDQMNSLNHSGSKLINAYRIFYRNCEAFLKNEMKQSITITPENIHLNVDSEILKSEIAQLSELIQAEYNNLINQKDIISLNIGKVESKDLIDLKLSRHNNQVEVLVRKIRSNQHIFWENDYPVRIYEPIYISQKYLTGAKKNHIFFSPSRYIFNVELSTYIYNNIILWVYSFFLFVILYFNSIKSIYYQLKRQILKITKYERV